MTSTGDILLAVFITLIVLIIVGVVALYFIRRQHARNAGLEPPSINPFANRNIFSRDHSQIRPARGGMMGWLDTQLKGLRNPRTAGGAYERTGRRAGGGALDPDEAWDARVGAEADVYGDRGAGGLYEEQELGLNTAHGRNSGNYGYAPAEAMHLREMRSPAGDGNELDRRFDEETSYNANRGRNPFADNVERSDMSLRGVSPRPVEDSETRGLAPQGPGRGSLEGERKSAFHENM